MTNKNVRTHKTTNNIQASDNSRRNPTANSNIAEPNQKIGIGIITLAVILVYLIIRIITSVTKESVMVYEVSAGQLAVDNTFKGVITFDESARYSDYSGYISYFLPDNTRAGTQSLICGIDETGAISSMLDGLSGEDTMDTQTLQSIRKRLLSFQEKKSNLDFDTVYNLKDSVETIINNFSSENKTSALEKYLSTENSVFFNKIQPEASTQISYMMDSLFGLQPAGVTQDTFSQENYTTDNLKNRTIIAVGSPLYRIINSEQWNIVFPMNDNQVQEYSGNSSVKIHFTDEDISTTASFCIINNSDGNYGVLTLNNYVINFLNQRFVNFDIYESSPSGLKIPVSSVLEKEFYTIPTKFSAKSVIEDMPTNGFYKASYDNQGNENIHFVAATYYAESDGFYYVNKSLFDIGDKIVLMPEDIYDPVYEKEYYTIGTVASLKGVYSVNKGYCLFRKVEITDQNDEYCIVNKGTKYGISIYDHIILNSDLVVENQIIY